jgi:hypothetical protein
MRTPLGDRGPQSFRDRGDGRSAAASRSHADALTMGLGRRPDADQVSAAPAALIEVVKRLREI